MNPVNVILILACVVLGYAPAVRVYRGWKQTKRQGRNPDTWINSTYRTWDGQ